MLDQLVVTGSDGAGLPLASWVVRELAGQFPSVHLAPPQASRRAGLAVPAGAWRAGELDYWSLDCQVDAAEEEGDFTLRVTEEAADGATSLEILNRCQRSVGRRNRFSQTGRFDAMLTTHRKLHDLSKPLVRADYNHARDTWQWLLRLDREASLPLQLAALFHDVERLVSEPDARVEQHAADYQQFKDRHAGGSAELAEAILARAGFDAAVREKSAALIRAHERYSAEDVEVRLLNEADALSFFSLNSSGFLDYFGPEHTTRKIRYTLCRLGEEGRRRLSGVRLRPDVRALFEECAG
ncbi:MAG TPA: DUF4202 family protein [Thermoanaerobaculia bacterium]|jgi:hypothetical protein|nr:DUF4202 family protein [Thermoanaerobaculia bacterium]